MDITAILGLVIGIGGILMGMVAEHGNPRDLLLLPPFIIVFGGATGALLSSFPLAEIKKFTNAVKQVVKDYEKE